MTKEDRDRMFDLLEDLNRRVGLLEGDAEPEPLTADNAQVGDWIGSNGFYVGAIEHGESAVIATSVTWDEFLQAVEQSGLSRG